MVKITPCQSPPSNGQILKGRQEIYGHSSGRIGHNWAGVACLGLEKKTPSLAMRIGVFDFGDPMVSLGLNSFLKNGLNMSLSHS